MLDLQKLQALRFALKRTFSLPITRSTIREVQNVVYQITEGKLETANAVMEALLTGEVKKGTENELGIKKIADEFLAQATLSRDIYERGEFVNNIYSEPVGSKEQPLFLNRVRRIDGDDFQFLSDLESTFHLLGHFINRLHEVKDSPGLKQYVKDHQKDLNEAKEKLEALIS